MEGRKSWKAIIFISYNLENGRQGHNRQEWSILHGFFVQWAFIKCTVIYSASHSLLQTWILIIVYWLLRYCVYFPSFTQTETQADCVSRRSDGYTQMRMKCGVLYSGHTLNQERNYTSNPHNRDPWKCGHKSLWWNAWGGGLGACVCWLSFSQKIYILLLVRKRTPWFHNNDLW